MVNITIDDKNLEVPEGSTVLQAARIGGIEIPTLCDHPELTPYGGCRLCLVEIEGARALQPSCTLPVSDKMIVRTNTDKVKSARKFVLTLIFSERNHFCPYCQVSGGDCELQNAAYDEGMTHWPLQPNWKPYAVDASNPYFVLDNNRCILCRRCVRACSELTGIGTLGFEERGARSFLVADLGVPLGESTCVSCGTCVQICPTGALIDRQSAYRGHDIQLEKTSTLCIGCSVGCGIDVFTRDNNLMRIDGSWDAPVNGGVLCKTGRFMPMEDQRERLVTPLVRKDGKLKAATWEEAYEVLAAQLKPLASANSANSVAAMASTRLPAEALYLFKSIFADNLHTNMVTSMEEGTETSNGAALAEALGRSFETNLDAIDEADCIITVGVDPLEHHEVAGFFVKRSVIRGVDLVTINAAADSLDFNASAALKVREGTESDAVQGLIAAVAKLGLAKSVAPSLPESALDYAATRTGIPVEKLLEAARLIGSASKPVFIYGKNANAQWVLDLAGITSGSILSLKGRANSTAAAQYALDTPFMVNGHKAAYIALGDDEPSQRLIKTLEKVDFLAVQATYVSQLTAAADVVLPVTHWLEQEGHYVNLEGRIQKANPALVAPDGVRSNTEVLNLLAARLGMPVSTEGWMENLLKCPSSASITEAV